MCPLGRTRDWESCERVSEGAPPVLALLRSVPWPPPSHGSAVLGGPWCSADASVREWACSSHRRVHGAPTWVPYVRLRHHAHPACFRLVNRGLVPVAPRRWACFGEACMHVFVCTPFPVVSAASNLHLKSGPVALETAGPRGPAWLWLARGLPGVCAHLRQAAWAGTGEAERPRAQRG